jgi:hypothetical protein
MNENNTKKKETLTFYRKMANTNITIMKNYKSAVINKMNYKDLLRIYNEHNINFKKDIERLHSFIISKNIVNPESDSEPNNIDSESSESMSEPKELEESSSILERIKLLSNNLYLPVIIPVIILSIMYVRRSKN